MRTPFHKPSAGSTAALLIAAFVLQKAYSAMTSGPHLPVLSSTSPPPPPAPSKTLASLLAEERFNILYLLAIVFPILTAIVGSVGLYAYRQHCIKQYHRTMALRNAQLAQCSGEDDAAAILPREAGSSSYLFTTKRNPEASAASDTSIDASSWLFNDMEAGLSSQVASSTAPLANVPPAGLLPRRRSSGKAQPPTQLELTPR